MDLEPTQWFSFVIAVAIMALALWWRRKEHFRLIFPVLFLIGFHIFLFYAFYGFRLYLWDGFQFHIWSQVLRLHTQLSILLVMFTRHFQMKAMREQQRQTLEVLRKNGNGVL